MAVPGSCFSIVVTAVFVGPTGVRKYEAGHQQEREYHEFFHGVLTKTLPRSAWAQSSSHPFVWIFKFWSVSLTCQGQSAYPPNG